MEFFYNYLDYISVGVAIVILLMPFWLRRKYSKNYIVGLPITIGILGTFFGVFIGLLQFDTNNIEKSIPELIGGLQTAFITSIAGLFTNLTIRLFPGIYGFQEETDGEKTDDLGEQLVQSMKRVADSISGDGESTMVTQLQKIRTTNSDGFDKMKDSFEDFAEQMVADNTQSLVDALTQVMKDFNTKINEQFGENFKHLNEAVGAMVEWQKEYKEHVEQLTAQFENIAIAIQNIDKSLKSTADSNSTILETNELLRETVSDFSSTVKSFAELGDKAKDSFPVIEQNMTALTETSNKYIKDSISEIQDNYQTFTKTQRELMSSYNSNIESMIKDNAARIKALDNELGQELNKALESLGSQLTSLSKHFVNDYKPLTDKLREVVELANRLK